MQPILSDTASFLEFSRLVNRTDDLDHIYGAFLLSLMGKLRLARTALAFPPAETFEGDGPSPFVVLQARGKARALRGSGFVWERPSGGEERNLFPLADHTDDDTRPYGDAHDDVDDIGLAGLRDAGIAAVMPIRFSDRTFALALLGEPVGRNALTETEEGYAMVIGSITAIAAEGALGRSRLHETNRRLQRRARRLHSLFEASRALDGLLQRDEVLRLLGFTLMGEMGLTRFALYMRDAEGYRPEINRFDTVYDDDAMMRLRGLDARLVDAGEGEIYQRGVRAIVPLHSHGEAEGILLVGPRLQYEIDEEDLEYFGALGGLVLTSLENTRLLGEMIDKRRLEEDLRIASEIQRRLLPGTLPEPDGYAIAAESIPASEVGGDCYDAIALPDGTVLLTIADVSGKGAAAALLMASMQAAIRALAPLGMPLGALVARVNNMIVESTPHDAFITAFLALLDPTSGTVEYVNAGHNPPLHTIDGETHPLTEGGPLLGVIPTIAPYPSGRIALAPGESLLLYTDGVSEGMDGARKLYGEDRLATIVGSHTRSSAMDILTAIRHDLDTHVGTAPRSDDITLLCVKRMEVGEPYGAHAFADTEEEVGSREG